MSVSTDVTIWCDADECNEWYQGDSGSNASRIRRTLARRGWTRVRRDGRVLDLCPDDSAPVSDPERKVGE